MEQIQHDNSSSGFLMALILAGSATIVNDVDTFLHLHNLIHWMHLGMQATKGLCYLTSTAVGIITIHKYLTNVKHKKNGHK
jgi:uncharacterized BrkB/YihY/UPF0761 family membrane protein